MRPRGSRLHAISLAAAALLAAGCSGTVAERHTGMDAGAHRSESELHAREALEHREKYDPEASLPSYEPFRSTRSRFPSGDFYWPAGQYNPTERHREHAGEHEQHARQHLAAARELEAFEEDACVSFPPETRTACPFAGHVEAVEPLLDGARVRLDTGIDTNAAMAHMRCHLAFARARAPRIDHCPLYLPGVRIERVGDSRDVDLTVSDATEVPRLQDLARGHLVPRAHH